MKNYQFGKGLTQTNSPTLQAVTLGDYIYVVGGEKNPPEPERFSPIDEVNSPSTFLSHICNLKNMDSNDHNKYIVCISEHAGSCTNDQANSVTLIKVTKEERGW